MGRRCHECTKWTPTDSGWGRCAQDRSQAENVDHACEHFKGEPMTPDEILAAEERRLREEAEAYRVQWEGAIWKMEQALGLAGRARTRGRAARAERLAAEATRLRELADKAWAGRIATDDRLHEIALARG